MTIPQKPPKLGWDLSKWPKFWGGLRTYLSQCRGAAHIPLVYLIRDEEAVVPNADPVDYVSVANYLMATTKLEGDHYKIDNA
jgi:hypothetical protein